MFNLAYFGREPLENRLGRVTHEVEHGWQVVGVARKRPRPPALFEFSTADVTQLRLVYLVCDRVTTVSLEQPIACVAHAVSTAFSYPRAKASTSFPAVLNLLKRN